MNRRFTWPVNWLIAAAYLLLAVTDGFHELRRTYHPIEDLRTYRTWRRDNKRKVAA